MAVTPRTGSTRPRSRRSYFDDSDSNGSVTGVSVAGWLMLASTQPLSLMLDSERIFIHWSEGDPVDTLLAVAAFENRQVEWAVYKGTPLPLLDYTRKEVNLCSSPRR
jgi:hypothetical protein